MMFKLGKIGPEFKYGKIGLLLLDMVILLGLILAISCLFLAGYILYIAYCSDFWVLLGLSLFSFLIAYVIYTRLRRPVLGKFVEASHILATESSRTVTLRFPGVMGWSGALIELADHHAGKTDKKVISLGVPKKNKAPKGDIEVDFWSDKKGCLSTIVVHISGQYLVGTIRNQAGMRSEFLRMRRLLVALQYLGCLAVALIASYLVLEHNRLDGAIELALNSHNFPTTEAHIISSQISETRVRRGKAKVRAWYPQIQYAYSLQGEYMTGQRFSIAPVVFFDQSEVEAIVQRYPPGSMHQLYYDPNEYSLTILEPGHQQILQSERVVFLTKWIAILIATIALTILFWLGRKRILPEIQAVNARVYRRSLEDY